MIKLLKDIATIGAGQGAPQGDSNYCDVGTPFVKAGNLQELIEGKNINDIQQVSEELPEELLVEGGMKDILTNKYERNLTARKKCIAVYGTACQICGFDFGAVYGPEFAGKIHVHHKLPLYEIKEDYVVDPVKDLIPVCPNCHMILHSKPGGVYTIDEVKLML